MQTRRKYVLHKSRGKFSDATLGLMEVLSLKHKQYWNLGAIQHGPLFSQKQFVLELRLI